MESLRFHCFCLWLHRADRLARRRARRRHIHRLRQANRFQRRRMYFFFVVNSQSSHALPNTKSKIKNRNLHCHLHQPMQQPEPLRRAQQFDRRRAQKQSENTRRLSHWLDTKHSRRLQASRVQICQCRD